MDAAPVPVAMDVDAAPVPAAMDVDAAPVPAAMDVDAAPVPAAMDVDEDLSSLNSSDSPPTRLEKEASPPKPFRTFTKTMRNPDGKLVEVEVELRRGASGSRGMPNELLADLMRDEAKAAFQAIGCGAPMAEAMASRAVDSAEARSMTLM